MSAGRYKRIKYTIFDIAEMNDDEKWSWCYSARQLEKDLQEKFVGHTLKAVYVDLEGYLEALYNHKTDYIDLFCEASGCIVVFDNAVLALILRAEGQFEYRIEPIDLVKIHSTKDYPPNDYEKLAKCYFDISNHDITVGIDGQTVNEIRVRGTELWCFMMDGFDVEKAELAGNNKDLPAEIDICTELYDIRLVGSDIESFSVKIEKK